MLFLSLPLLQILWVFLLFVCCSHEHENCSAASMSYQLRGLSEDAVYNPVHHKRYLFFLWGLAASGVFHSFSSILTLGFSDLTNLSTVLILSKTPLGH